jgi:hypothetical protein
MRALKPVGSPPAEHNDPIADQKRIKKRIQNRNAQRSYREKQAAYIRALEKMVSEKGKSGCENSGSGSLEEIRELQEASLHTLAIFLVKFD